MSPQLHRYTLQSVPADWPCPLLASSGPGNCSRCRELCLRRPPRLPSTTYLHLPTTDPHSVRPHPCRPQDLSQQAFQQLADISNGVIGIKYRQVDCPGGFVPSPRGATWDYAAGTGR